MINTNTELEINLYARGIKTLTFCEAICKSQILKSIQFDFNVSLSFLPNDHRSLLETR